MAARRDPPRVGSKPPTDDPRRNNTGSATGDYDHEQIDDQQSEASIFKMKSFPWTVALPEAAEGPERTARLADKRHRLDAAVIPYGMRRDADFVVNGAAR